jgi:hypothetical protein
MTHKQKHTLKLPLAEQLPGGVGTSNMNFIQQALPNIQKGAQLNIDSMKLQGDVANKFSMLDLNYGIALQAFQNNLGMIDLMKNKELTATDFNIV